MNFRLAWIMVPLLVAYLALFPAGVPCSIAQAGTNKSAEPSAPVSGATVALTKEAAPSEQEIEVLLKSVDGSAQRELGERLIVGGDIPPDKETGEKLLEAAIANGDLQAKVILGKMLLDGFYLSSDGTKAIVLLQEAASANNPQAQTVLGTAYLWGQNVKTDPKRAEEFLAASAAQGDPNAERILGEQLVYGTVLPADQKKGVDLLQSAIDRGDPKAAVSLGAILLYGSGVARDQDRAKKLFEAAAAIGDGEGLQRYGSYLIWQGRPTLGEKYLRQAADLGRDSAWTDLAEAALWKKLGKRSLRKYEEYARKARATNQSGIAVLDAQRKIWGLGTRKDPKGAISLLEESARKGNADAAVFLIELVRDGNNFNVARSPDRASAHLDEFAPMLSPRQAAQQRLMIEAVQSVSAKAFAQIAAIVQQDPAVLTADFSKKLFNKNRKLAVYLLQIDLAKRGVYKGPVKGKLTKNTVSSALDLCRKLSTAKTCKGKKVDAAVFAELMPRLQASASQ